MEEDIKILEEIVDIYYDCAGNKEQDYDMVVDMGFMKKEAQAIENLIKGYREERGLRIHYENRLDNMEQLYIDKDKIKEKIEEFKKLSYEISGYDFKCVPKDLKRNDYAVKMLEELLEVKKWIIYT